jgi:SAM-dependent methyltransferase
MEVFDSIITAISYAKQPRKRPLIKEAIKLKGKKGIEIGGPSQFFQLKGGFPVYVYAGKIDNVNYGSNTFFGDFEAGDTFQYYKNKVGHQFIAEATDLHAIANDSYDFILSSHSLEHTANPIKALKEWNRVLRPEGKMILLLPDKRFTMDHKRDYTTFTHLLSDYENNTSEADTTHFDEVLLKFDAERHKTGIEEYKKLLLNNVANRCVHHHVFSQELVKSALEFSDFIVDMQTELKPFHLVTVATKKA